MKYLKLFESFEDIHEICDKYGIKNYTINPDGSIDVHESVYLSKLNLKKLPLKFNKVNGWFSCSRNKLKTLEGFPIEINNGLQLNINELTSFKYSPKIIRGVFSCEWNNIKSFEYFPIYVGGFGGFYCQHNPIFEVWRLFEDTTKIELLNDFDIFRDEDTDFPSIILDRLNDFLLTIGKRNKRGFSYKKITDVIKNYKIV